MSIGLGWAGVLRAKASRGGDGRDIFDEPTVVEVSLRMSEAAEGVLRKTPREWVDCLLTAEGKLVGEVGVHLKSTTSFMPVDQKPSLTLSLNRSVPGGRLYGLRRIHLNNSAQDASYLCEGLCHGLFVRAGVPCARVAWAKVRLNDRDLGLYVLKEGLVEEFLKRHFKQTTGNFYDGGLHNDIWSALRLDSGEGPTDRSDLKGLHAATQLSDLGKRWEAMQKLLDVPEFVSMMAMESLTCHIDGYSLMQNNFRIYFNPPEHKAVFIAHGLDRMFETPEMPVEPVMKGTVSKAVLEVPEGRKAYRARLGELAESVFVGDWMDRWMDRATQVLASVEAGIGSKADALRGRIRKRVEVVRKWMEEVRAA